MEPKEIIQLSDKYPVVSGWLQNMPQEIVRHCRISKYGKGETLFRKGNQIKYVYIVCKGIIMISSGNINGNEMGIVFVSEGFSVGEMEILLDTEDLLYSAKVFSDSVLLEIPGRIFKQWIDRDSFACKKLATILAQKLYNASSSTVKYKRLEAITRVEMFLSEYGVGRIQETREELAEACGVTSRTINRVIAALSEKNEITLKRGKIEVNNEQLKKIEEDILEKMDQYK